MAEYLARLKNTKAPRAGTDKTDETPKSATFVSFDSSPLRAFEEKNSPTKSHTACTLAWLQSEGCNALPDDVAFLQAYLPRGLRRRKAVLLAYVTAWLAAMEREPLPHRRDNRGRFTANTLLREGRLAVEEPATLECVP